MVNVSAPDFHLDDKLFAEIVDDEIRPFLISCPGLHIIVPHSVDDWFQIKHKIPASVFFQKFFVSVPIDIIKMLHKFFQQMLHVQRGSITIGVPTSRSAILLPQALARFHREYPEVAVRLMEAACCAAKDENTRKALRNRFEVVSSEDGVRPQGVHV